MSPHWPTVNARAAVRKAKFDPASVPEPAELTEQCEQRAKTRAVEETAAKALCATCGLPRGHVDHLFVASRLNVRCRFVEASS